MTAEETYSISYWIGFSYWRNPEFWYFDLGVPSYNAQDRKEGIRDTRCSNALWRPFGKTTNNNKQTKIKIRRTQKKDFISQLCYWAYMLWFIFFLRLFFIFLCFKLIIIDYHTPKQEEIKFRPWIKLNHKIYVPFSVAVKES